MPPHSRGRDDDRMKTDRRWTTTEASFTQWSDRTTKEGVERTGIHSPHVEDNVMACPCRGASIVESVQILTEVGVIQLDEGDHGGGGFE